MVIQYPSFGIGIASCFMFQSVNVITANDLKQQDCNAWSRYTESLASSQVVVIDRTISCTKTTDSLASQ